MARRRLSHGAVAAILGLIALVPMALIFRHYRVDIPPAELEALYAGPSSRFLEVEGTRVHYRDEGQGPVLLSRQKKQGRRMSFFLSGLIAFWGPA